MRSRKTDPDEVTFIVDRNINYTNVCITDCDFCAFYRRPGDTREGYVAAEAGDPQEDRGDARARRHGSPDAGRPPPDLGIEWYEDLFSRDQVALQDPPARALPAGDPAHLAALEADARRDALAAARRGARLAARRRRRGARRPRAQDHRAQEDEDRRVARRHARGAPPGHVDDRDDDVRPRRDARGARRAPAPHPRPAGRDCAASARSSRWTFQPDNTRLGRRSTRRRPRSTTCARRRSRGSTSTTSTTSSRRGSRRARRSARWRCTSAPTTWARS